MFLCGVVPVICLILFATMGCSMAKSSATNIAHKAFSDPKVASLAEAVASGDVKRIRDLIKQGIDVNARGDKGMSLLQWAVLNKSSKGLAALLDAGADPTKGDDDGETVMRYAAMANDPIYLQILLDHHVDPNISQLVSGEPPLSSALLGNRDSQFAMLLKAGADLGHADRMGNTPLHVAAKINAFDHVLDLLEAGAPPDAINRQNCTFQCYLFMTPTARKDSCGLPTLHSRCSRRTPTPDRLNWSGTAWIFCLAKIASGSFTNPRKRFFSAPTDYNKPCARR